MQQMNGYITVRGAAEKLGMTKMGVHKRIYRRNIPTVRFGNLILVKWDEVRQR